MSIDEMRQQAESERLRQRNREQRINDILSQFERPKPRPQFERIYVGPRCQGFR